MGGQREPVGNYQDGKQQTNRIVCWDSKHQQNRHDWPKGAGHTGFAESDEKRGNGDTDHHHDDSKRNSGVTKRPSQKQIDRHARERGRESRFVDAGATSGGSSVV
jgi:hypothetical protein